MRKSLVNFVCLLSCLIVIEYACFIKDYNELVSMAMYIEYDITNSDLKSFYNEKYEVIIDSKSNNLISYEIILKRNSLFKIKRLKTIKSEKNVSIIFSR